MKKNAKNYLLSGAVVLTAVLFLFGANVSDAAAKTVSGEKGADESLMKVFRQIRAEEGGNDAPQAGNYLQRAKLTMDETRLNDNFGISVAIIGNTAVIGAWGDNISGGNYQGSAYVFVRNSAGAWNFQQKLTATDGAANDYFGWSVAIANASVPSQTVIMVGAFGNDAGGIANKGAVYVFTRNSGATTWTSGGKLTVADGAANDVFGNSVAMTGSYAIIGANGDDGTLVDQGAAYIFVRNGSVWEESQKLISSQPAANGNFGWSVDISGNYAVVGMNQTASLIGKVEVFERPTSGNTWLNVVRFVGDGNFGYSVAISGETFIVGSYLANTLNPDDGAAYIFTRNGGTWSYQRALRASDVAEGDNFGFSVDVSGDTAVVGARRGDVGNNTNQGSAYVFTRSGTNWTERQKITDSTGEANNQFSWSVAISGDTIIVGSPFDDIGYFGQLGSASIFTLSNASAPYDFDGDGKSDISVFRQSNGAWYIQQSQNGFTGVTFGFGTDIPVPADYDGDGKTDVAVFRNGVWYYLKSSDNAFVGLNFGQTGDLPRPADFDGDGKADINVFRPSNGAWYRLNSSNNSFYGIAFGQNGDKPLLADFDGDGKNDVAVFRPSTGSFYSLDSSNGAFRGAAFGFGTDIPTPADFDGDGKTDVAVFRPSNGAWYRLNSSTGAFFGVAFGQNGDIPTAADYDGDGKSDIAVFRNGIWYLQQSTNGFSGVQFGLATDTPVPASYVP